MTAIDQYDVDTFHFLMGNEAIARGALEAGIQFAAGYPGTPSSEVIERLSVAAKRHNIHVEWSTNEKAATEGVAAAAFTGLRALATMKNAGLSVALDFLTHLSYTGIGERGGAMVTVVCDDPEGHSSGDETDSRWLARFASMPLLEASTVQEAKDMVKWGFDLSEEFKCNFMFRGYTRLSHASSSVCMGMLPSFDRDARSDISRSITPYLAKVKHKALLAKLAMIEERFETSPFNIYEGSENPELLIVCGGSGLPCSFEAIEILGLEDKVGILRLATLWPFPTKLLKTYAQKSDRILVVEEVDPYIEIHVKEALSDSSSCAKQIYGKGSGHIPLFGEITPDKAIQAIGKLFELNFESREATYQNLLSEKAQPLLRSRGLTWCAGCPHRASFWALDRAIRAEKKEIYVTGDIGCYTLDVFPEGKEQMKLLHAMGSGTGLAAGLGQLSPFNYRQPVIAICGDSTFYHASVTALINAVYNGASMIQVVLENFATAMTGFQSHPGTGSNAMGNSVPRIDIETLCRSLGCQVLTSDPFDTRGTIKIIRELLKEEEGVKVLILRRSCEILRMKEEKVKPFEMGIDDELCKGETCAICSSEFRCPALFQNPKTGQAKIKNEICSGCGVCVEICPFKAITRREKN